MDVYRTLPHLDPTPRRYVIRIRGAAFAYTDSLWLRDVEFLVDTAERDRATREGTRTAHAFVRGCLLRGRDEPDEGQAVQVRYEPGAGPFFATADGQAIRSARVVHLGPEVVRAWLEGEGIEQLA